MRRSAGKLRRLKGSGVITVVVSLQEGQEVHEFASWPQAAAFVAAIEKADPEVLYTLAQKPARAG